MKEIWKDIPGFEKLYQASTKGRIRSLWRKRAHIMRPYLTGAGYNKVDLKKDGIKFKRKVSRLVASTFLGDISERVVNHLDFNKLNDCISNLEICTISQNVQHNLKHGKHGGAKLSPSMVMSIRKMYNEHTPQKVIANLLGVSRDTISRIVTAKSWSQV